MAAPRPGVGVGAGLMFGEAPRAQSFQFCQLTWISHQPSVETSLDAAGKSARATSASTVCQAPLVGHERRNSWRTDPVVCGFSSGFWLLAPGSCLVHHMIFSAT